MFLPGLFRGGVVVVLAVLAGCESGGGKEQASPQIAAAPARSAAPVERAAPAKSISPAAAAPVTATIGGAAAAAAPGKAGEPSIDLDAAPKFASSVDLAGIRLGMAIEEALAALGKREGKPTLSYTTQAWTPEAELMPPKRTSERSRLLPLKPGEFITEINSWIVDEETIKILFALPPEPNVVAGVTMKISSSKDRTKGTRASALLEALGKKYGNDHASAPRVPAGGMTYAVIADRWLVSPGEDCYSSFAVPTMDKNRGAAVWTQPSNVDYQKAPAPSACATAVVLQATVGNKGEFEGLTASYTLTLANEGHIFLNDARHKELAKARKREWLVQRQKHVAEGASPPKL